MGNAKCVYLEKIAASNNAIYENLMQAYEAEFSYITKKMPDALGLFSVDTCCEPPYEGYLAYHTKKAVPIGFVVVGQQVHRHDIAEFYIIPALRRQAFGEVLAHAIFDRYPGEWQVRQIEGADQATLFWRSVIDRYTHHNFEESIIEDPEWGKVIRQLFHS